VTVMSTAPDVAAVTIHVRVAGLTGRADR